METATETIKLWNSKKDKSNLKVWEINPNTEIIVRDFFWTTDQTKSPFTGFDLMTLPDVIASMHPEENIKMTGLNNIFWSDDKLQDDYFVSGPKGVRSVNFMLRCIATAMINHQANPEKDILKDDGSDNVFMTASSTGNLIDDHQFWAIVISKSDTGWFLSAVERSCIWKPYLEKINFVKNTKIGTRFFRIIEGVL